MEGCILIFSWQVFPINGVVVSELEAESLNRAMEFWDTFKLFSEEALASLQLFGEELMLITPLLSTANSNKRYIIKDR